MKHSKNTCDCNVSSMDKSATCGGDQVKKKPIIDFKRCFTDKHVCMAIKACPVKAISYIEVDEPIWDKQLTDRVDRCPMAARGIKATINLTEKNPGCLSTEDFETRHKAGDLIEGVGNPWGRIIIDYDKCIYCGKCATACCGYAIDLI